MKLKSSPNRFLIYYFHDKNGVIDQYVDCIIRELRKSVSKIFFVSNGKLERKSKERVTKLADEIYERQDEGFEAWGYKGALHKFGLDKIKEECDELILMNYTIMGPLTPFCDVFSYMDNVDVDFWGLTKHHHDTSDRSELFDYEGVPEHLQSHFIAVRKKMLSSKAFKRFWDEMPKIDSLRDSFVMYESRFTKYFAKYGFKWTAYVDTDDLEDYTYNPILYAPVDLIKNRNCPIFKIQSFASDYSDVIHNSVGENARDLMSYLENETDFDVEMIWDNLLRCYPMEIIKNSLHLNYTLPEVATTIAEENYAKNKPKVALVFHVYFMDLLDSTYDYVNSMPSDADIYLTVAGEKKINLVKERFKKHKFNKLEILPIENRGRDVSALLVPTKDFIMDYDYVCFAHDKKTKQIEPESVGAGFAYQCLENTLGSEGYVKNVIDLFEKNKRLGILMPPPPFHSAFLPVIAWSWGPNFEITESLAKKLKLNVPMSPKANPVSPLGTMFWFRTKGMKKLFDRDWSYSDFPKEPNKNDGTLLHAIERIYGLVEQDAGYYGAWCVTDKFSALLTTNTIFMISGFVDGIMKSAPPAGYYSSMLKHLEHQNILANTYRSVSESIANTLNLVHAPVREKEKGAMRLYYSQSGDLCEENSIAFNSDNKKFSHVFRLNEKLTKGALLRFDPEELKNIVVSDLEIVMNLSNKKSVLLDLDKCTTNGIFFNGKFVFDKEDPNILWTVDTKEPVVSIKISATVDRNVDKKKIKEMLEKVKEEQLNGRIEEEIKKRLSDTLSRKIAEAVSQSEKALIQKYEDMRKKELESNYKMRLYFDNGNDFSESDVIVLDKESIVDGKIKFRFDKEQTLISRIRLDPGEKSGVCVKISEIKVETSDNVISIDKHNCISNGLFINKKYVFVQDDPWIIWKLPEAVKPLSVEITMDLSYDAVEQIVRKNNQSSKLKIVKSKR